MRVSTTLQLVDTTQTLAYAKCKQLVGLRKVATLAMALLFFRSNLPIFCIKWQHTSCFRPYLHSYAFQWLITCACMRMSAYVNFIRLRCLHINKIWKITDFNLLHTAEKRMHLYHFSIFLEAYQSTWWLFLFLCTLVEAWISASQPVAFYCSR